MKTNKDSDWLRNLGTAVVIAWAVAVASGCSPLTQEARVSECGGFETAGQALEVEEMSYCDAEVLQWRYEAQLQRLTLTNTRVLLNCCGEHSMDAQLEGSILIVTETDAPEQAGLLPGGARCDCMCVYDYELDVGNLAEGTIEIELVREVTDAEAGPDTVWIGVIDLAAGHGGIVLDETEVEPWCSGEID